MENVRNRGDRNEYPATPFPLPWMIFGPTFHAEGLTAWTVGLKIPHRTIEGFLQVEEVLSVNQILS